MIKRICTLSLLVSAFVESVREHVVVHMINDDGCVKDCEFGGQELSTA